MGELMTKHMWDQRHKEVEADTRKYVVYVAERYKAAYTYCVLKKLRKSLSANNDQTPLLEQRKWQNYNRPLHRGAVYVLRGIDQKKWRRRYCVLQPDYTLEVYDSKEDFEAANRPRFVCKHSSYEVVENIDVHMNQLAKEYLRDFGYVCDNVSNLVKKVSSSTDPAKRPTQHILALYHPYRGSFYIAADSALEKDQWLKSMQDAERQLLGIHCEDEVQREAFAFTIKEACAAEEHCDVSVKMCGRQEEITADFITDYLANGCKAMLQTKVKGDMYKKYKMWGTISHLLSIAVQKIVETDYPPIRAKAEAEVEEMKQKMLSSLPQINTIYETASTDIIAGLEECLQEEMVTRILPKIPDMVTRMGESILNPLREVKDVFVSLSESVKRQVSSGSTIFANNIDCFFINNLDSAPRNPEVMHGTFQAAIGKRSAFAAVGETFPKAQYSELETKLCVLLQKHLDSAVCTFEVLCGDAVAKNSGHIQATAIAKIEARVLKKLSHDNVILIRRFLTEATQEIVFEMLHSIIYHDSRNKMRSYEDIVPAEFSHFLPIGNVFRDVVVEKLGEDLKPSITAALKRLTHDRYSMMRYHSSSTINSHSSVASDESPSSVKQDSSVSRTSSVLTSPGQKSPAIQASVGTKDLQSSRSRQDEEVSDKDGVQCSDDGESGEHVPNAPPDGFVQDGETGECLEKLDENGEVVRESDVQNKEGDGAIGSISAEPNKLEEAVSMGLYGRQTFETREANVDLGLGEGIMATPIHREENISEENPIPLNCLAENSAAEPPLVEESLGDLGDADSSKSSSLQNHDKTADPDAFVNGSLHSHTEFVADSVYGQDEEFLQTGETEEITQCISTEPEVGREADENTLLVEEETAPQQNGNDTVDVNECTTNIKQDFSLVGKQSSVEEDNDKEVDVPQNSDALECNLTQNVGSDAYSSSENSEKACSNSPLDEEADGHKEEKKSPSAVDFKLEMTSSKQESSTKLEEFQAQSNGSLKQNGHSEALQNDSAPAAPTRKKRGSFMEKKDQELQHTGSDLGQTVAARDRMIDTDLEKYNGVVEQIIHTGEEKLI